MSERIYNFSAGPATLPESVIKKAQAALWNLGGSGVGVMEHSHRGAQFSEVIQKAEETCRKLAGIPDDYAVLFLQGGASSQFFMLPMNFLGGKTADYVNTGAWSKKAIKEAKRFGTVHVAGSSEDESFTYIPSNDSLRWSEAPAYAHFTSNNTISGTEFKTEPTPPAGVPLFCDASSDIFSRPIDVSRYAAIYAGAQKNLGPSGVTLVIIRKDLVAGGAADVPTMLSYRTHVEKASMFNTPPTFAIYVLGEVLAWLDDFGGLEAIAQHNEAKAEPIYELFDNSDFYRTTVRPDSRSLMNICFRSPTDELDKACVAEATERGLSGLKGHRSVGGMRASVYNAFPREGCDALVEFLKEFERTNK